MRRLVTIKRTTHPFAATIEHVGVDHGRGYIAVAEQFLHCANIIAMAERVQANPAQLKQRKELIEHVFDTIKRSMDQGYFLLRTRKKVASEMSLTVLAYNLKRVITILGVKGLMAGLIERVASLWSIVWWLMRVPQWCK